MKITKKVSPAFEDFLFNWDYERFLLVGGYGSGKSYHIAFKIILKLLEEVRKVLVVRQVFDTIYESCFDLFCEILNEMNLLAIDFNEFKRSNNKCVALKSPLRIRFPNGSQIIFKGMDKPEKVKSINGVSIVWMEECSEMTQGAYTELLGRIRTPDVSMHLILSCNPVSKENWVYEYFFVTEEDKKDMSKAAHKVDEEKFYEKKCIIKNGIYYHHSIPTDNPWLPWQYLKRLDDLKLYDYQLYTVARWGRFGASGTRVFPQFSVFNGNSKNFKTRIENLGIEAQYFGFDFGFEDSYNCVLSMSVDVKDSILYIWDEIYVNQLTDPEMVRREDMQRLRDRINKYNDMGYNKVIVADNEDPKAIQYYRQMGFVIRPTRAKFNGSRISNLRKIKRFRRIIVSPKCVNTIRELKDLTFQKDARGKTIYDKFNIDPHSLSAVWYGLDTVTVADVKQKDFYSKKGGFISGQDKLEEETY